MWIVEPHTPPRHKLVSDNTPYAEVQAGKTIPFAPGVTVSVLSATPSGDLNQGSLVLKVTDGKESFLLPGDSSTISGDMRAQILKVPHHGSSTALTPGYINQVGPEVAVISVGAGNTYGHPAANTISSLQNAVAKVYRTDTDGTVVVTTDGTSYSVKTSKTASVAPVTVVNTPAPVYSTPISTQPIQAVQPFQTTSPTVVVSTPTQASSSAVCDCSSNKYNCPQFLIDGGVTAQECYDYCMSKTGKDIHGLDRDKDGGACDA